MKQPTDEAVGASGRDSARARRWAIGHRQFDLVRAEDNVTYLTRWWLVKTPWGGIALHRMTAPDARPTLHDHPWSFLSIVLRGGYWERRLIPRTYGVDEAHHVRRFNWKRPWGAHSIRLLDRVPTWTLLFIGPVRRTWGFIEPLDNRDAWRDWLGVREGVWRWTKHDAYDSGHYNP